MTRLSQPIRSSETEGVSIPRALLEESGLQGEVEVTVEEGRIILSNKRRPREGWEESFMDANPADDPNDPIYDSPTSTKWDETEWEWPEENLL